MADQLPPTWVVRSHQDGSHLPGIQGDSWQSGPGDWIKDIVAVHVEHMCVEAHVVKVPDDIIVDTHLKSRVICVNVAVQLRIRNISILYEKKREK